MKICRSHIALLLCLFVIATASKICNAGDEVELTARVNQANTALEIREIIRGKFNALSIGNLKKLTTHKEDAVAVYAAWEKVRRTVSGTFNNMHSKNAMQKDWRIPTRKLSWYQGFLEGRLRVNAPDWWGKCLARVRARNRDVIGLHVDDAPQNFYKKSLSGWIRATGNVTAIDNDYVLVGGNWQVKVSQHVSDAQGQLEKSVLVDGTYNERYGYIVCAAAITGPYKVFCVDASTGNAIWSKNMPGRAVQRMESAVGNIPRHWFQIIFNEDRLVIFGVDQLCVYVDVMSASKGEILFSFNSSY